MPTSDTGDTKLFRGDYSSGEKPHNFLRHIEGKFDGAATITAILHKFSKSLEPGRPADVWFGALTDAQKASWTAFYGAFIAKWPLPVIVEPTNDELLSRLYAAMLDEADLGTLVERDGEKVYAHVAWAEEIRSIVNGIGDDNGLLISVVRRNLPLSMRLALRDPSAKTWDAFLTSITSLSMERLQDHIGLTALGTQPNPTSMTSLVDRFTLASVASPRTQLPYPVNRTTPTTMFTPSPTLTNTPCAPFQRATPPHQTANWNNRNQVPFTPFTPVPVPLRTPQAGATNPFLGGTTAGNNAPSLFKNINATPQTPTPNCSQGPSLLELANRATSVSITYANTTEGVTAYNRAMIAWETAYSSSRAADFTTAPYPLRPGTANIGSKECFRCGLPGHIGSACPNLANQLDKKEQDWRSLVSRHLYGGPRGYDMYRVSQISAEEPGVAYDPSIYDAEALGFEDEEDGQGNGQGVLE